MEVLIVIVVLVLLIGIFKRTGNRTRNAWFTRPCPHCRQTIDSKATVCPWCTRDVPQIEPGRFEPIKRIVAVALVLGIGYAFVTKQAPQEKPRETLLSGVAGPTPVSAPETKASTLASTPETKVARSPPAPAPETKVSTSPSASAPETKVSRPTPARGQAENSANDYLLASKPEERAKRLGNAVGEGCVGKTTFYGGIGTTGFAKNKAFWSVRCTDGSAFMVTIEPDGSSKVMDCKLLKAMNAGECFKKLAAE